MSNEITIIIANKCRINITPSAEVFTTRSAKSKVFSIPHSQIISKSKSEIDINSTHKEPATKYVITKWIFGKNKFFFDKMHDFNIKIGVE